MADNVDPTPPESDAPEGKKPAWKKWLPIALLVLVGAGAAGGWFYWKRAPDTKPRVEAKKPVMPQPVFLALDPFTVNLRGDGQFLQIAFSLQLAKQEDVGLLQQYLPQARSRLLMLLTAKSGEEIESTEGKQKLIADAVAALKQPFAAGLPPIQISNIFITSFVIQ